MKARLAHLAGDANQGKIAALDALHSAYTGYVRDCVAQLLADRLPDLPQRLRRSYFAGPNTLTSQIRKNAQAHAADMVRTWVAGSYSRKLRDHINEHKSEFTEHQLMELRCIGKYLLREAGRFGKGTISQEMVDLYWQWVWDPQVSGNPPEVRDTLPMWMTQETCRFNRAEHTEHFGWWIRISTLTGGERIDIPLTDTPYMHEKLAKSVMVRKDQVSGRWVFQLTDKTPEEVPKGDAGTVGLDVGLNCLAADSSGNLYGAGFKPEFDRQYQSIRRIRANRQRQGLKRDSKRLARLERRLSGFCKTATGTVVNRLIKNHPNTTWVLEDLDLRGCRGQKRFAYRQLQSTLGRKAATEAVNPAYTSQMCPSCGYVDRANRSGTSFSCKGCERVAHADWVGASNLLERSQDKQIGGDDDPACVLEVLRGRYRARRSARDSSAGPKRSSRAEPVPLGRAVTRAVERHPNTAKLEA